MSTIHTYVVCNKGDHQFEQAYVALIYVVWVRVKTEKKSLCFDIIVCCTHSLIGTSVFSTH